MTVVVGYIPTPEGNAALDSAIDAARQRDAHLVVANSSRGSSHSDKNYIDESGSTALDERLTAAGVEHTLLQQLGDVDAGEEVLNSAERYQAELIVIGLRHRTPVGKLIMGSTAQRILLEAPCPVLAVKADYSS